MKTRVYVAGVYSITQEGEKAGVLDVLKNIGRGQKMCSLLFQNGFAPFCPWHDRTYIMDNPDWDFKVNDFYEHSLSWLSVSDCMLVISGEGLNSGVDDEILHAEVNGIPVFYSLEDLYLYEDLEKIKQEIDELSQYDMAKIYRFSPSGSVYFNAPEISNYFMRRFKKLGGFTPEISKKIGWEI